MLTIRSPLNERYCVLNQHPNTKHSAQTPYTNLMTITSTSSLEPIVYETILYAFYLYSFIVISPKMQVKIPPIESSYMLKIIKAGKVLPSNQIKGNELRVPQRDT